MAVNKNDQKKGEDAFDGPAFLEVKGTSLETIESVASMAKDFIVSGDS